MNTFIDSQAPSATVRWLRIPAAVNYCGISRSTLYVWIQEGKIKSALIRKKGALRGIRIVCRESLDNFLETLCTNGDACSSANSSPTTVSKVIL